MPIIRPDAESGLACDLWLVRFDAHGTERTDDDGERFAGGSKLLSSAIVNRIAEARRAGTPYTDVVVMTHGWLADEAGAIDTFTAWAVVAGRALASWLPGGRTFRPLVVGVHWPSAPGRLGQRASSRLDARAHGMRGRRVPFEARDDDPADRTTFLDVLSLLLPWASFYRMKDRAQTVGRSGGATLLDTLRGAAHDADVHLVGHSFGCKLLAEALTRQPVDGPPGPLVSTLFLMQGAFSAWGFSDRNGYDGAAGSVRRIVDRGLVGGAVVATTSRFDYALRRMFPGAEFIDLLLTKLKRFQIPIRLHLDGGAPRLAALGAWGFAGLRSPVRQLRLAATAPGTTSAPLAFAAGAVHRLESDDVITAGPGLDPGHLDGPPREHDEPLVGGHSNLLHPELAGAFWQAAFVSTRRDDHTA